MSIVRKSRAFVAIAGTVAVVTIAGCGGSPSHSATATVATPQAVVTTSPTPSATPKPIAKPLSFYAAQYLRIVTPSNKAATKEFKSLTADTTYAEAQPGFTHVAGMFSAADTALVRAHWPSNVRRDIRALTRADANVVGDFDDIADVTKSTLDRDGAVEQADANIVRADLGLKATK